MNPGIIVRTVIAIFSALGLSNCILTVKESPQTKGRQLMDLKEALRTGAISKADYEGQKAAILKP